MPTLHPAYAGLSTNNSERGAANRTLLRDELSDDDLRTIHIYLPQQRALGRDDFRVMVETKTRHHAGVQPVDRPRKP